jgi:hypothetical protein
MGSDSKESVVPENAATVCRLSAEGINWRVVVESWRDEESVVGRLVFEPDTAEPQYSPRQGSPTLRGGTHEAVVLSAHDLSEHRLKEVLYSLR